MIEVGGEKYYPIQPEEIVVGRVVFFQPWEMWPQGAQASVAGPFPGIQKQRPFLCLATAGSHSVWVGLSTSGSRGNLSIEPPSKLGGLPSWREKTSYVYMPEMLFVLTADEVRRATSLDLSHPSFRNSVAGNRIKLILGAVGAKKGSWKSGFKACLTNRGFKYEEWK